jgi:transcriptional regulator of acetoin/glycerol metabolism
VRRDHEARLQVARAARAEFLERSEVRRRGVDGVPGVRDVVAASWRRSRSAGVAAEEYLISYHDDVDVDSRLMRCARPVIDRLAGEMFDVPAAIALSDAQARIVHRRDCSTVVGRPLDRVDFNAGFSFAEGGVGTNGIGTVFESGTSVAVVGAEHFTQALVAFACTGAPILDPVSGRVEGVLDVSSLAEDWTPLMHTLVRRAAGDIGRNLLLDRNQATQALFETFVRADSRPRQAVMAVGDSLMVNQRAQQLFDPAEQQAIHQHALFLMSRRDRVRESFTLDSGRQVRIRATRILVGEQVAGIVLLLQDESDRAVRPVGPPAAREPSAAVDRARSTAVLRGRSPAWVGACDQVADAIDRGESVLVLGEPGSGRSRMVAELFGEAHPAGRVTCWRLTDPVPDDAATRLMTGARRTGPLLMLLPDLDRAEDGDVERLARLLDHLVGAAVVAATVDDARVGAGLPFERLLGHFEQSVTLPPLRFRREDLPMEVDRLLREIAPGRRVRLHPDAGRVMARFGWPGNVTQLREALRQALLRRPVGQILPEDLPAWVRTAGIRTLTTVERAERDVIVGVLQQCGGNRMQATTRLGMSRSSLYRKIKQYRITDV